MARDKSRLIAVDAGFVPYEAALSAQRWLARAKKEGRLEDDFLLLLEHEPVLTLGRGAESTHVLASAGLLEANGIRMVEIERGGDVTYHGPGQLVGYPILDLRRHRKDLHWYLRTLEDALIRTLAEYGLSALRVAGRTGVWVGERDGRSVGHDLSAPEAAGPLEAGAVRKIASIGVHVGRWVTWHGFALNVTPEPLDHFRLIVPCGIPDVEMTSMVSEGCNVAGPRDRRLLRAVVTGFGSAFGREPRWAEGDLPEPVARLLGTSGPGAVRRQGRVEAAG